MGSIAALLAGACVAPVVIQVVVFASNLHASGTSIALALPFVLGLGMGLPWPIAGAGLASLPKPGAWMVRVKQAMGVLILATAVLLRLHRLRHLREPVGRSGDRGGERRREAEGRLALVAEPTGSSPRASRTLPVIIDFWATWCKNCVVMDETTLKDPAVKAALEGYTRIKFQSEVRRSHPAGSDAAHRRRRLPAYVILRAKPGL